MLTLIIGGARSGKSSRALAMAREAGRVLFVATAEALDADMAERIARHRQERPAEWSTLEVPHDLAEEIGAAHSRTTGAGYDCVVVDCLTLWVSNVLLATSSPSAAEHEVISRTRALLDECAKDRADWIIVTNEVGLGIVPESTLGRTYRDLLGRANALVAAEADRVLLMVAGLAVDLKPAGR